MRMVTINTKLAVMMATIILKREVEKESERNGEEGNTSLKCRSGCCYGRTEH